MDPLEKLVPLSKRLFYKWKALRTVPFRSQFFVGYDLSGNTYWEFTMDRNFQNLRRKIQPHHRKEFTVDYYKNIPPQWHQWLRFVRNNPPTIQELLADKHRQEAIKELAKRSDEKWEMEKLQLEGQTNAHLKEELDKIEQARRKAAETAVPHRSQTEEPIRKASLKPRR
ncbi:unnamed protein product [Kuraishia capsulata CBS 1993]|uniref:NADH dehydrogenase [ubiquinone] 1 alpha subcomplex subunit n=1 Tax=Kuraishia capsulata CBS 1993 TaxID=1382522 RepID=W6MI48_9ASCO|nr:uncharacterized protein KUCA_T00001503001 [Kuraishia capsulata CBS 1993]CDK25533.1 unnamed protein product [Kuraishia capsulata CBS 1993]